LRTRFFLIENYVVSPCEGDYSNYSHSRIGGWLIRAFAGQILVLIVAASFDG
jgi:hypothetical protein